MIYIDAFDGSFFMDEVLNMARWIDCRFGVASVIVVSLVGCGREDAPAKKETIKPVVQVEVKKDNQGKPIPAHPVGLLRDPKLPSFREAVILDESPEGELRPASKTYTGKNAVKIFESIANDLWDQTTFTNADGKPIAYEAVIATELGDIHVDLRHDAAPNHVRSFVCLAKAGYYDGMDFYYSFNRKVEDDAIAFIEAGCPRGTGELGSGSIGYWLRPEISTTLTHEAGVLGACLGEDPNSASCRFYITAIPMRQMDGRFTVFGKVTRGLDVVHTINRREVHENDRLKQPVTIKNVAIRTMIR